MAREGDRLLCHRGREPSAPRAPGRRGRAWPGIIPGHRGTGRCSFPEVRYECAQERTIPMASLSDVAKAAGVSLTTASLVLNRPKQPNRVSEGCSERVRAVAKRLG